ncbi:hypothetical protein Scep_020119 [Stephania cephalantha]|uniref:Uncharacterized protein n=1 Tax=Stephania cephalantha TaxID=152367 RepID=A0AAP0NNZ0_9MAGN
MPTLPEMIGGEGCWSNVLAEWEEDTWQLLWKRRLERGFSHFSNHRLPALFPADTVLDFKSETSFRLGKRIYQAMSMGLTLEENVSVEALKNVEVNEDMQMEDYWSETAEGIEVFQTEPEIIIAQDEKVENEMKIEVISKRPEKPQKESKEDKPLVLVKPPTLPCIFVKPFKGWSLKESVHVALPKAIDAPFVLISRKERASRDKSRQV